MLIERSRFGFRGVAFLVGALILLWGCRAQEAPPEKPTVVRKTILPPVSPPAANAALSVSQKDVVVTPNPESASGSDDKKAEANPQAGPGVAGAAAGKDADPSAPEKTPLLYSPEGKIDPFVALIREKTETPGERKEKPKRIPQTPLEKMDLSQMKLTAIIVAPNGNKALVEEANGKGYIISEGTYIGLHSGVVTEISKNRVTVEEEVEDVLGKIKRESKELKLQKQPGEF